MHYQRQYRVASHLLQNCSTISLDSVLAPKPTQLVEQFKEAKILVVGDGVLDENQYGFVSAVSDEAPISVMSVEKVLRNPGAAGNVAVNIARLGA